VDAFHDVWTGTLEAFGHGQDLWERGERLALSALVGLGRRTVTGLLATCGHHQCDWSADYRLFERSRFDGSKLFVPALTASVQRCVDLDQPIVMAIDDTLARKRGRKVFGAAWRRDPQGPKFQTNLVWGQRFFQASVLWPEAAGPSRARAIPVDLRHCPTPVKPSKNAGSQKHEQYRVERKTCALPRRAVEALRDLRSRVDTVSPGRRMIVGVDGGYTNRTLLSAIPPNTTVIGRVRKDAKLFAPPPAGDGTIRRRGRPRLYGQTLPTPEQLRKDPDVAWIPVQAFAAGRLHDFQVKVVGPVRWTPAGGRDLVLVIIKPLAYRLSANSYVNFRDPAYLLCSDSTLDIPTLLQAYVWRWEIEQNFRDEKTLLGIGDAQVRTQASTANVPTLLVAAYASLLTALHQSFPDGAPDNLMRSKWNPQQPQQRITTPQAQTLLRQELWADAIHTNYPGFAREGPRASKSDLFGYTLPSAVFLTSQ
jgi:hypothetical protein